MLWKEIAFTQNNRHNIIVNGNFGNNFVLDNIWSYQMLSIPDIFFKVY